MKATGSSRPRTYLPPHLFPRWATKNYSVTGRVPTAPVPNVRLYHAATRRALNLAYARALAVSGAVRSDEGDNYGDTPLSLKKINISAHVTATLADSLALFNESLSSYLGVNCSSGDGDEGVVDARLVCHCEDHIWRVIVQLFNTEYNKQVNICQCFTMKQ